ncbi:MAG: hypothetical protein RLZZ258_1267, partial [Actinomycetota bacterium]
REIVETIHKFTLKALNKKAQSGTERHYYL